MTGRRPWDGSTRRARLPKNWPEIRLSVLARDGYWCQLRIDGVCIGAASEADHVQAGDDHSMENLQAGCQPCHAVKSAREGAAARPRLNRPVEVHPALK